MTTTAEIRQRTSVVTLVGEFDRANLADLQAEIEWCLQSTSLLVLDLSGVTYADGALLSLLLDVLERLGDAGWLSVAGPSKHVERLFAALGLSDLPAFHVYPTLQKALEAADRA